MYECIQWPKKKNFCSVVIPDPTTTSNTIYSTISEGIRLLHLPAKYLEKTSNQNGRLKGAQPMLRRPSVKSFGSKYHWTFSVKLSLLNKPADWDCRKTKVVETGGGKRNPNDADWEQSTMTGKWAKIYRMLDYSIVESDVIIGHSVWPSGQPWLLRSYYQLSVFLLDGKVSSIQYEQW